MKITASQIAQIINGIVEGDVNVEVSQPAPIESATKGQLTFFANPKYEKYLYTSEASIIIVPEEFEPQRSIDATLIKVPDVYQALAVLYEQFSSEQMELGQISDLATIDPSSQIGEKSSVGAHTVVGKSVSIGAGCRIYPQCYIDNHVEIGDNVTIHPGVRILSRSKLENNIIIHANAVIGSDGFGFVPDENGTYQKIQQLGNVHIESDVEIGANVCIDRAALGSTVIERGVKLDNLIHVAHNVRIGANTVIAAQAGIAGSTQIGPNTKIGGQAGIVGHLKIGAANEIQAQSGVTRSTKDGTRLYGYPAIDYNNYLRSYAAFKNLPQLLDEIKQLRKQLDLQSDAASR